MLDLALVYLPRCQLRAVQAFPLQTASLAATVLSSLDAHGSARRDGDLPMQLDVHLDGSSLAIRRAAAAELVDLRHIVLRQGLPREEAMFAGDELPTSRHYGAFQGDRCVACATLHLNEWQGAPAWQLRGMATDPSVRGKGIGRALLAFMDRDLLADDAPVRQLWCNARTPAAGFYQALGWTICSDVFDIPTAGPHYRMARRLTDARTPEEGRK
jgi:GNAT superfamily N-acetyltransferase